MWAECMSVEPWLNRAARWDRHAAWWDRCAAWWDRRAAWWDRHAAWWDRVVLTDCLLSCAFGEHPLPPQCVMDLQTRAGGATMSTTPQPPEVICRRRPPEGPRKT